MKNFKRFEGGKADNTQQNIGICRTTSENESLAESGWYCTRAEGHTGEHSAGNGRDETYATWED